MDAGQHFPAIPDTSQKYLLILALISIFEINFVQQDGEY